MKETKLEGLSLRFQVERVKTFLKETKLEAKKITWPQRKQVLLSTATVIFLSVFIGAYLGLLDMIYNFIISIILR